MEENHNSSGELKVMEEGVLGSIRKLTKRIRAFEDYGAERDIDDTPNSKSGLRSRGATKTALQLQGQADEQSGLGKTCRYRRGCA